MSSSKQLAIWLVRQQAAPVGALLQRHFDATLFEPWRLDETSPKSIFQSNFNKFDSWILVMATGIAVRYIDGLVKDKTSDPAVVVLDEGCHYAISLVGGHEAGANKLAVGVANVAGAQPVITTASESLKPLTVGIGCRKGASAQSIRAAVRRALGKRDLEEIREVATIDLKCDEPGLKEFCAEFQLPLRWFSRESVAARTWVSKPSEWVKQQIGADGVCEPCALMVNPRSRLLVTKIVEDGVTVAVTEDVVENVTGEREV